MRSWKIATLLALLAAAAGCAGNPPASEPAGQVQPTSSSVTISSVEQATSEGATHITLKGNFPFSYTSYEPDYSTMVLELLDVDATPIAGMTAVNSPEVESLETSVRNEGIDGSRVSQVTFHFKRPTLHQMRTEGNDLRIEFQPDPTRKPFPENSLSAESSAASGAPLPEAVPPAAPVLSEAEKLALEKARPATALLAVLPKGPDAIRKVQLKTNGKVDYKVFELSNPSRLVIDMENVLSQVPPAQRS
ncbi:MAG: AMIN domain-containing protein, partial [Acidobacteria bacterium]|nr:AMIN domain-containing protein [Acidobacteriota bacterium]